MNWQVVLKRKYIDTLPISDTVQEHSTHLCKHCGEGIYYHLQGADIGNQPSRHSWCADDDIGPEDCGGAEYHEPYEGEADGINATYKTSIKEEPNLVHLDNAGGTVKLEDYDGEMYENWRELYLDESGQYKGAQPVKEKMQ